MQLHHHVNGFFFISIVSCQTISLLESGNKETTDQESFKFWSSLLSKNPPDSTNRPGERKQNFKAS